MTNALAAPPWTEAYHGGPRRVGVEIEFASVSPRDAAHLVQVLFGGDVTEVDPHRFAVGSTRLGDFVVELDSDPVHAIHGVGKQQESAEPTNEDWLDDFRSAIGEFIGEVTSLWLPSEIAAPAIVWTDLPALETLVTALRHAGAEDTKSADYYAFGLQLNPEIASEDPDYLTRMLKAEILLSDWLRESIQVDRLRRLLSFADPFPLTYRERVTDPDYAPELDTLIEEYLLDNATRNRELDMLPLFAWLQPDRVAAAVTDTHVKSRPTFHYRLPDCRLGDPEWSIIMEWNRWVVIESLAADTRKLDAMCRAYQTYLNDPLATDWLGHAKAWLSY